MNWLGSNRIPLDLGLAFVAFHFSAMVDMVTQAKSGGPSEEPDNWSGASSSSDHSHDGTSQTTASARSAEDSVDPQSGRSHHGC